MTFSKIDQLHYNLQKNQINLELEQPDLAGFRNSNSAGAGFG